MKLPIPTSVVARSLVMLLAGLACQAPVAGTQPAQPPLLIAHAIGAPHQHGAHAHHDKLPKQKAGKSAPQGRATRQA